VVGRKSKKAFRSEGFYLTLTTSSPPWDAFPVDPKIQVLPLERFSQLARRLDIFA